MSTYDWYLFGHLAGVFLLLAAAGLTTGTAIALPRQKRASTVVTLLEIMRWSEMAVTSAGAVLVVLFGSLLIDEAGYEFGDAWISTAYVLVVVALAVDHGFLMPRARRSREVAAALGDAPVSDELRRMLNDPLTTAAGVGLDILFVVFLWLMIDKPGA
jgi:uncharacterized membrane protein